MRKGEIRSRASIETRGEKRFLIVYRALQTRWEETCDPIEEELNDGSWKWNSFKNNPNSPQIQEMILETV